MTLFTKESLESLRDRVDLVDLISGYVELKRAGTSYKGLCPFHDEKTPSFTIQKGDAHYHCFGCGAHGDAIAFLMEHLRLSFAQAVELLAERFNVILQKIEIDKEEKGLPRAELKQALDDAAELYHYCLLHSAEGRAALLYLFQRGVDEEFIREFRIGYAPSQAGFTEKVLSAKNHRQEILEGAGIIARRNSGATRDFFSERITFPILDPSGSVIGFSARKIREEVFGGKYINTTETQLFKKSKVLFGLPYCRRRIAKEREAIIVEGQLDALRLIHHGLNLAVAALGTAFGESHISELVKLGVERVYLAFDGDPAGSEAALKVGHLFQKEGVDTLIVPIPIGSDPDTLVQQRGVEAFQSLMSESESYLPYRFKQAARGENLNSPPVKSRIVYALTQEIRSWKSPLQVHESLKLLSQLASVPEEMIGVGQPPKTHYQMQKSVYAELHQVDPQRILEGSFIRWLLYEKQKLLSLAKKNIPLNALEDPDCRELYTHLCSSPSADFLTLASEIEGPAAQVLFQELVSEGTAKEHDIQPFKELIQKILDRNWMEACEAIRIRIRSGEIDDDEALKLLAEFNQLKKERPQIQECSI